MSPRLLNIGVVGATGMVGQTFIKILEERKFPTQELRLFASSNSIGLKIGFRGRQIEVQDLKENCFDDLDVVFFSSGDDISATWAPKAVASGAVAIDNSSAFRMHQEVPLIVPEVNGDLLPKQTKPMIIANPNCSTIQLVVALNPLMKKFGIERVQVATYQSVSGAGLAAQEELKSQVLAYLNHSEVKPQVFPHPIAFTNLPQIGSFEASGFTGEEIKVMKESRKILRNEKLNISAMTVRTPTMNGHSEAVWVTFEKETTRAEVLRVLGSAPGIVIQDDPTSSQYPLNSYANDKDPVFVGRVHQDLFNPKTFLMWVVADNIRKGAALNGIQIAEQIFDISN